MGCGITQLWKRWTYRDLWNVQMQGTILILRLYLGQIRGIWHADRTTHI